MNPDSLISTSGDASWILISASLVLLMTPALALFYGGMSSHKSVLNMMMMAFGAAAVVSLIYVLIGWSMSYGTESFGGIFANPFQHFGLNNAITAQDGSFLPGDHGYPVVIDIGFQLTFAIISCALICGALADRVKFSAWLIFVGFWVILVYFPLAHMVWGGGVLSHHHGSLAATLFGHDAEGFARIPPIDFAGGVVVHISAGTAALVLAIIVGHRRGFLKTVQRPHNLPMVMLGAALLWFGWCGFNAGSAFGATALAGLAWLNTATAACAGIGGWLIVERIRDKRATSLGAASGVVAGLVSITPAAGDLTPLSAILLGAIGGALSAYGVALKYRFKFDDSLDVVGVHLLSGLWGTVAVGLFASGGRGWLTGGGWEGAQLFLLQLLIAVIAMALSAAMTLIIALGIKYTIGWRIDPEDEHHGIDFAQHGESAYDNAAHFR